MSKQIRIAFVLFAAVVVAACGRAEMSPEQATQVAVEAFESAGLTPEVGEVVPDATVDRANDGEFIQVHQVELTVDGISYEAGVHRSHGAVIRLFEPAGTKLTEAQLDAIAEYRSNPADDDARPGRIITALFVILALLIGVYMFFRNERLKAEAESTTEEILLD